MTMILICNDNDNAMTVMTMATMMMMRTMPDNNDDADKNDDDDDADDNDDGTQVSLRSHYPVVVMIREESVPLVRLS